MRAVVVRGVDDVAIETVEDARVERPTIPIDFGQGDPVEQILEQRRRARAAAGAAWRGEETITPPCAASATASAANTRAARCAPAIW